MLRQAQHEGRGIAVNTYLKATSQRSAFSSNHATATEAGVIACDDPVIVGLIFGTLTWKGLWDAMPVSIFRATPVMDDHRRFPTL